MASCAAETGRRATRPARPLARHFPRVKTQPLLSIQSCGRGLRPALILFRSPINSLALAASPSAFFLSFFLFTAKPFPAAALWSPGRAARVQVGCVRWRCCCCRSDPRTLVGGDEEARGRGRWRSRDPGRSPLALGAAAGALRCTVPPSSIRFGA